MIHHDFSLQWHLRLVATSLRSSKMLMASFGRFANRCVQHRWWNPLRGRTWVGPTWWSFLNQATRGAMSNCYWIFDRFHEARCHLFSEPNLFWCSGSCWANGWFFEIGLYCRSLVFITRRGSYCPSLLGYVAWKILSLRSCLLPSIPCIFQFDAKGALPFPCEWRHQETTVGERFAMYFESGFVFDANGGRLYRQDLQGCKNGTSMHCCFQNCPKVAGGYQTGVGRQRFAIGKTSMGDCTQGPRVLQVFCIAKSKFVSRKEDVPKTLQSYR